MDTVASAAVDRSRPQLRAVEEAQSLKVTVTYGLSEAGRKVSLLSGGDGRARQELSVLVPPARLHLVTVNPSGVARLKLQPLYELTESERVVRHDGPPIYDAPPTFDDLYRDAARNHELERLFVAQRQVWRGQRRESDHERRAAAAREFLSNAAHRAMTHPTPTPRRCFVQTASGRVMFDIESDFGVAKDVPPEAHRRFRADLNARRQRNLAQRAEQEKLHQQKKDAAATWLAKQGTAEQQSRAKAGLLAFEEIIAAIAEDAFQSATDISLYERDGAAKLQSHLRQHTGDVALAVPAADLVVASTDSASATAKQWQLVSLLQATFPDASIKLRQHLLSSRRHPDAPPLALFGVLVTRRVGPFNLRREFAAPGGN